ncbi:UDP-3-O-(3-hydroxymyristoyl)glucosamine N-acyltransferase [Orrella marina]|uniref:UDP-3-O-acylglucosamine N-acyltransferase n=1 Tax=Orrella marina TaxID=2163011 RepID=A0A2R4XHD7_9BURK|nr:UDP-3-O-(3-hydroxymyristoyl)glucosamine N-acyltransferase [Orrella marina]AWB33227.1 UDP-3-O-(3-hydroxymyristoyl)glucosamine N-acyltransferase [Orrella marina]
MPILLSESDAPSLADLVGFVNVRVPGLVSAVEDGTQFDRHTKVQGIGSLASAGTREISFIVSAKYESELASTQACAVAMQASLADSRGSRAAESSAADNTHACDKSPYATVICREPYLFYAVVAGWFEQACRPEPAAAIHPSAVVADDATVDPSATIGPNVVIGARSFIGANTRIEANCTVGDDCEVGPDSVIYPNVTLYERVRVGARAIIHAGVVLGADGFGFAPNPMAGKGAWGKIAQLGGVRIGDDVEIGANTTIDRGALEDTTIGNGVKLDNLIMIAHNCQIGDHTAMAACVGMAGSTIVGQRCIIGGAAMFAGHLTVVDDVQISGGTAVTSDVRKAGRYTGVYPFDQHTDWQKNAAVLGQLSTLRRRLRDLERRDSGV